ncbi:hypothetical protein [Nodosilinea sp. E11]|uniref:hypothetical protein n=1 Tax=Nodosilinea sp. E11 TaxID=3037479 RepID=UPI0029351BD5|nr:hypothetical protein [Nodosilinea sp. E11]WOD39477.1 hypothetical protein RRF56_25045 [Nodosilinea sp. E11]
MPKSAPESAPKSAIENWGPRLRRIPVVVILGALLVGLWGLSAPAPQGVVCDRAAPGQVYCQASLPRPWAWWPQSQRAFALEDVALTSELCDNTPRGGVRFCHRLTLRGAEHQVTLSEVRTPLSAAALRDQLHRYIAGEGSPQLIWSSSSLGLPWRTLAITLLLAIATWALWDIRWPPLRPLPQALDGLDRSSQAIDHNP